MVSRRKFMLGVGAVAAAPAVLGDAQVGIEIKSSAEVNDKQLRGLRSFGGDYPQARLIVVSFDKNRRRKDNIEIIPVGEFLADLWSGKIY